MKVSLRVFNTLAELRNPSATPPAADIRSCMPSSTHIHSFPNDALRQASSRFYLRQLLIDARAIQLAQPIAYHCTAFNIRRLLSIKHAFVHIRPCLYSLFDSCAAAGVLSGARVSTCECGESAMDNGRSGDDCQEAKIRLNFSFCVDSSLKDCCLRRPQCRRPLEFVEVYNSLHPLSTARQGDSKALLPSLRVLGDLNFSSRSPLCFAVPSTERLSWPPLDLSNSTRFCGVGCFLRSRNRLGCQGNTELFSPFALCIHAYY